MSTRIAAEPTLPRWQEITGLCPDLEPYMSRDERESAIRKLVQEVQRMATAEFTRKVPAGERTYLYDPIHFICNTLGISRVKLSRYTQELTGMSAYEVTDKIKARTLPEALANVVAARVEALRADLREAIDQMLEELGDDARDADTRDALIELERKCVDIALAALRREREGTSIVAWAANLGYANPARLRRAAVLQFGRTVESMEEEIVRQKVSELLMHIVRKMGVAEKIGEEAESEKIAPHNQAATAAASVVRPAVPATSAGASILTGDAATKAAGLV